MRRRLMWIIPGLAAVAATGFLLAKSPNDPVCPPAPATTPSNVNESSALAKQVSEKPETPGLPITQVILYSNGVGYFQRDGQVEGNAHVDLSIPVQDVNDLLKSMVLQDLGGGQVSAVSYDSRDPLDKTLNSFAIRLADNPGHAMILHQARGEKVELTLTPKMSQHSEVFHGTIVGVERKAAAAKDAMPVEMLNLWCQDGMRNVPLTEVAVVRFLNPAVESEMRRALEVLATGHDSQKKSVSVEFSGTGKRDVRLGYVVETPLWRTSYRLLVDKSGKAFLQGWALVENPSNEDWKNVRMALVSARPISFRMDLYQPLYSPRPVVQNQVDGNSGPVSHARADSALENGPAKAGLIFEATKMDWSINDVAGQKEVAIATGGAASPLVSYQGLPRPVVINYPQIGLQQGVVAAAKASDLGTSFEYAIEQPVTIARQKSALLPIVNQGLQGDKVSVYSPQAQPKYALLALRLKNTTGVHLMQGPVAVFEKNGYAGDAQLPDFRPGEDRLISYAVDLGIEVETQSGKGSRDLATLRLEKGVLKSTTLIRTSVIYKLHNRSPHDRVVLVEHSWQPGYRLISKDKPAEVAADVYRFEKKVPAGKIVTLEVVQESDVLQTENLIDLNAEAVAAFAKREFKEAKAKAAFAKLLAMQQQAATIAEQLTQVKQQLADIERDQGRLRANLKEMPATSTAYKRYLEKFDQQETAIEKLQTRIEELQVALQQQRSDRETYVHSLDLEATAQEITDSPGRR